MIIQSPYNIKYISTPSLPYFSMCSSGLYKQTPSLLIMLFKNSASLLFAALTLTILLTSIFSFRLRFFFFFCSISIFFFLFFTWLLSNRLLRLTWPIANYLKDGHSRSKNVSKSDWFCWEPNVILKKSRIISWRSLWRWTFVIAWLSWSYFSYLS